MTERGSFETVSDITDRRPGILDHDIEAAADFVEYHLQTEGDEINDIVDAAEDATGELLETLTRSVAWHLRQISDPTREDVLKETAEAFFRHEQTDAVEAVQSGDDKQADISVAALLAKWPVELEITYSPSPLFPRGRQDYIPLDLMAGQRPKVPHRTKYFANCRGNRSEIKDEIIEWINRPRETDEAASALEIQARAENALGLDEQYYEQLRRIYGTKAAELFVLSDALDAFRASLEENYDLDAVDVTVPRFTAAPISLHQMYKINDERYADYLEEIRQQAIGVTSDEFDPELFRPLVAVRSSAVLSEDGENASGAGVYASVAVDPRDPIAFREAVETVFASLETEQARDYLADKGLETDFMGLLIQQYVEGPRDYKDTFAYGYVHSSDPSGRFITLSSRTGELVFDRQTVESQFMVSPPFGRTQPTLHYVPDHDTKISNFSRQGVLVANAAVFAEKLFGKHVELEFALDDSNKSHVVQVRPLPHQEAPETVEFPKDIEPILECRAIGVGDVVVTLRDDGEYSNGELKLDWVASEDHQGQHVHKRARDAVFIIGYNDGYSGHIQMLARERGQLCLYPDAETGLPSDIERELTSNHRLSRVRQFRVVDDGYRGAVYPIVEGRAELLQALAAGISQYTIARATTQS